MKFGTLSMVILGLTIISGAAASAAFLARCRAEVLRSEELPYAPIGSWLHKATVRITYPDGQTVDSMFARTARWQATLRRGDRFRFDCERLRDAWPIAPQ
ncbi:hypothetical protein [Bradyrhizobium acaciae]|uniref:hypothetical protein n=1 Tax=Bradyrhizobium acaciae TaxID=2683706 RepID=UPI001E3802C4|nr:hypothetical protein [Bradyrhizobium acaciae]MCC8982742.1 hypothetical protein [Bradyrhizobium acaciae]